MTTANKITVTRLLLIPVFVTFSIYYSDSIARGQEEIRYRIAALAVFALAALSDAVDGFIARRFHQRTPFGMFLDPLADKLLLLSGIIVLSLTQWHAGLPIWFAALVITRDAVILMGVRIIHNVAGEVKIEPKPVSKVCTFFQLVTVAWVLLDFRSRDGRPMILDILIAIAAILTVISGIQYVLEGIRQLKASGKTFPEA